MKKLKITKDLKQACHNLSQSNDWILVSRLLEAFLERIVDIRNLTEEEKRLDLNSVVLGRLAAYKEVVSFLQTIKILSQRSKTNENDFE